MVISQFYYQGSRLFSFFNFANFSMLDPSWLKDGYKVQIKLKEKMAVTVVVIIHLHTLLSVDSNKRIFFSSLFLKS